MKFRALLTLLGICSICSSVFAEKFDLEVYASRFDSIPIGVVDFKSTGGPTIAETAPWIVLSSDLDFCGRFSVIRSSQYDSATFFNANVGLYVDGLYSIQGSTIIVEFYLRDASNKELIVGKKYTGDIKKVRSMVHTYSNELVEMLFGDKGIFTSKLLYVKTEGVKKNIGIMDFDGFNSRKLTNNSVINIFPTWENSTSMVYISYLRGKPDIYKGSVSDGSSKVFIHSRFVQSSPDVSPIDGTIAYASSQTGNMDIYTCDPDGSNIKQLTMNRSVETAPSWSPNGYQIAFTSDRAGNPGIYVMDRDGANPHRLSSDTRYQDAPSWSPKGDKIAYTAMGSDGRFDIWVVSPDGSNLTQATSALSGSSEYPTWSPDGSLVAFANTTGGKSDIYVVKADGTHIRRVTNSGDARMPSWSGFY